MKSIIISIIVAVVIIGGAFFITRNGDQNGQANVKNNVNIVDGKQIIEIRAKGGYSPLQSVAKAGVPTILRFNTSGTFDCSSAVRIPSMGISKTLPNSGVTDIDLGNQQVGVLNGTCGMGMYPFEIEFKS
jgi:plastocyanin domain-containing protein